MWWARNQYHFLNFPEITDNGFYPVTPSSSEYNPWLETLKSEMVDYLRPLMTHDSARLRRASLIGLARLQDIDSHFQMVQSLQDSNQTVRDSALFALGILQSAAARHTLLHLARATQEAAKMINQTMIPDYLRGFAEVSMALSKREDTGNLYQSVLQDPKISSPVKAMALESLGLRGGEDSAKQLIDFINSVKGKEQQIDQELLATAVAALGKSETPLVLPFLVKCLDLDLISVRQSAVLGLGQLGMKGDDYLVKKIQTVFRHSNDYALKGFALIAMGRIGGPAAIQYLERIVSKGRSSECPWACLGLGFALQNTRDDDMTKLLIVQATSHANRSVRGAAAIGLGLAGASE
ncbi:MAG: hypothetical protein KJ645_08645, partial [Planctomycetes bacterium]|nr:hypothetical protein [Planctomycetota bacterium]